LNKARDPTMRLDLTLVNDSLVENFTHHFILSLLAISLSIDGLTRMNQDGTAL
jgi:hypothetical protein